MFMVVKCLGFGIGLLHQHVTVERLTFHQGLQYYPPKTALRRFGALLGPII